MKKATVSAKSVNKSKATAAQRNKPSIPKGISWHWWLGLAIVVVSTFVAYSTCLDNDFTNWDDPGYIIENPIIKTMSGENIKRIFTEPYFANYQPLHIFSYMIEYHFFGLDASGYHWVSVIMHIINTLLVAFIALLLLKDRYIAIAVSLLFGVHSIHVESVAWAAERKDLLYTMFFFTSFIFYILFVQKSQTKWLIVSVVFFVFSIFSKAMAVSLVPVLFLIDVLYSRKLSVKLFLEKIPYLILALILGIVSLKVTKPEDAFTPTGDTYTLVQRLFFASHNLLQYFAKSVFPYGQSGYYQYPIVGNQTLPVQYYIAPIIVLAFLGLIIYSWRKTRWIVVLAGFFTATTFLILMLYTIGPTIFSERYTYISSLAVYLFIGLGVQYFASGNGPFQMSKNIGLGLIAVYSVWLIFNTRERCNVWQDSITFWNDVISKDSRIPIAYNNRGNEYKSRNEFDKAIPDLNQAIAYKEDYLEPHVILGDIYRSQGKYELAREKLEKALKINAKSHQALVNLGIVNCVQGRLEDGFDNFNKAISYKPEMFEAYGNRGNYYAMKGEIDKAIVDYNRALQINPDFKDAYLNLGKTQMEQKKPQEALKYLDLFIQRGGSPGEANWLKGVVYASMNNFNAALQSANLAQAAGYAVNQQQMQLWAAGKQQ
ncbi:MAG TPA: tetratricopeptide repeat protein [Bacteroidia bacterium]|nr:tetratricopeptide repeat protein [Bacteroidia bacterium]